MEKVLDIEGLNVRFYTYEGVVRAIEGIDLHVIRGETLGIVGETGCGKSVTALSIMNLVPTPGKIESGKLLFIKKDKTIDILKEEPIMKEIRGKDISLIFQEPGAALNPVYTVGAQIEEVLLLHRRKSLLDKTLKGIEADIKGACKSSSFKLQIYKFERRIYDNIMSEKKSHLIKFISRIPIINLYKRRLEKEVREEVIELLRELEIADPERVLDMYPHELSGGMQQRIVIAIALACNPTLLIADEPTTSLDVTIQAQILDLIRRLKERFGSTVIFITHDMGVIAEMCDRVAVMYAGCICEVADVFELFKKPLHPYTKALLESIPRPGMPFKSIKGTVPNLIDPPSGCRFHPRCPKAKEMCSKVRPNVREVSKGHFVSCHLYSKVE